MSLICKNCGAEDYHFEVCSFILLGRKVLESQAINAQSITNRQQQNDASKVQLNGIGKIRYVEIQESLRQRLIVDFDTDDVDKFSMLIMDCALASLEIEQMLAEKLEHLYEALKALCRTQIEIEQNLLRQCEGKTADEVKILLNAFLKKQVADSKIQEILTASKRVMIKDNKCLLCKKTQTDCKCEGGFKIIYHFDKPMSAEEMKQVPTFEEAVKTAKREIKNIEKIMKELGL